MIQRTHFPEKNHLFLDSFFWSWDKKTLLMLPAQTRCILNMVSVKSEWRNLAKKHKGRDSSSVYMDLSDLRLIKLWTKCRVWLCPNMLDSKLAFIRRIHKTTSQSLLYYSARLIQNLPNSKNFHPVLFVRIKQGPPICVRQQPHTVDGHWSAVSCEIRSHVRGTASCHWKLRMLPWPASFMCSEKTARLLAGFVSSAVRLGDVQVGPVKSEYGQSQFPVNLKS